MKVDLQRVGPARCAVGECPVWNVSEQAWYWVDIVDKSIWRLDGASAALSETSCLTSPRPLLASWDARALYIGPAFNLAAHRNAVAVLAIGLDAPLAVAHDPVDPAQGFLHCRTVLIEPNQLHLLSTPGMQYAFLYLDALSDDVKMLRGLCRRRVGMLGCDLVNEDALIGWLSRVERSGAAWPALREGLAAVLSLSPPSKDARIRKAAAAMFAAPAETTSAAAHAAAAGLSSSRFQHLFKEQTGVPFRRYRGWARLQATMVQVMAGKSLTEAAHAAGFSSSAHLSAAFKSMFGLPLTKLLGGDMLFLHASRSM